MEPGSHRGRSQPKQPRGIRRKQLECPFTWGILVVLDKVLEQEYDALWLAPDTWSLVLNKLFLAYQHVMRDELASSKKLLAECYMPLLRLHGFHESDCDLIEQYWTALKHVIDSSWAFVCCKTTPVKDMEPFLQSITPYSSMSDSQKSAVRGIHGKFARFQDGFRSIDIAIALNPNEGQWHLYRGVLMHEFAEFGLIPKGGALEELRCLRNSHALRATPQSTIIYALALIGVSKLLHRPRDMRKGSELLREALEKWPDNPYVNYKCGEAFRTNINHQEDPEEDLYLAEKCLRNTIKLIGHHKCKLACRELGAFLMTYDNIDEGRMYIEMAKVTKFS